MSEKIEPVFSADGWEGIRNALRGAENEEQRERAIAAMVVNLAGHRRWDAIVALVNDVLPDANGRKITRERIAAVREAADALQYETARSHSSDRECRQADLARRFADALDSYLPPEGA